MIYELSSLTLFFMNSNKIIPGSAFSCELVFKTIFLKNNKTLIVKELDGKPLPDKNSILEEREII